MSTGSYRIKEVNAFKGLVTQDGVLTYRDTFEILLDNIPSTKKVLATNTINFTETVHKYLFDTKFTKQVSNSSELFNPICEPINISQKSTSLVADVAEI